AVEPPMTRGSRTWFRLGRSGFELGTVHADNRSIAAGRDIRANTIQVGLDEQETALRIAEALRPFEEKQAALADQVARDRGVPAAPLHAVLKKLGEANVLDDEIPARLRAKADELLELRAQLRRPKNERPELVAIQEEILSLLDGGDFERARAVLTTGRAAAHA